MHQHQGKEIAGRGDESTVRRNRTARHGRGSSFCPKSGGVAAEDDRSRVTFFVACPAEFFVAPTLPGHARNIFAPHAHPSRFHATRLCVRSRIRTLETIRCMGFETGLYWRVRTGSFLLSFVPNPHRHRVLTHHGRYVAGDVHRREKNRWSWQERGYAREPFFFLTRALFEGFKGHGD